MSQEFEGLNEPVKFTDDGRAVIVSAELPGGEFLVQYLMESDGEYDCGWRISERKVVVDKLYDKTPTHKLDEQFARLRESVAKLANEESALRKQVYDATNERNRLSDRLKQWECLKNIEAFLDDKLTHAFVTSRYDGGFRILDRKAMKVKEGSYGDFRMLALLGSFNNNYEKVRLQWGLNTYGDGAGSWDDCQPFTCPEDAVAYAQKYVDGWATLNKEYRDKNSIAAAVYSSAKAHGLVIPTDLQAKADGFSAAERAKKDKEVRDNFESYRQRYVAHFGHEPGCEAME